MTAAQVVLDVLPDISEDTLIKLMAGLEELGVKKKEDIGLLSKENLQSLLKVQNCKRLVQAFQGNGCVFIGG